VTEKILQLHPEYAVTNEWKVDFELPNLYLLLSKEAAECCQKHVDFYVWKGLLKKLSGMKDLADYMGVSIEVLRSTLQNYQATAQSGSCDEFDKERFPNVPACALDSDKEDDSLYYVGKVTPVLHYCMGGISINENGNILAKSDQRPIPGLYACGEVAGGVHGDNRLAGNSLLECVVYGRIVARDILLKQKERQQAENEKSRI
jgi:succinate dehydrogenase/fumarate reductase flavoprotein subunit